MPNSESASGTWVFRFGDVFGRRFKTFFQIGSTFESVVVDPLVLHRFYFLANLGLFSLLAGHCQGHSFSSFLLEIAVFFLIFVVFAEVPIAVIACNSENVFVISGFRRFLLLFALSDIAFGCILLVFSAFGTVSENFASCGSLAGVFVVSNVFAFGIAFCAVIAAAEVAPFDLVEAESELMDG